MSVKKGTNAFVRFARTNSWQHFLVLNGNANILLHEIMTCTKMNIGRGI